MFKIFILSLIFTLNAFCEFFVGISYMNLRNNYNYSSLNVSQYIGTIELAGNQVIEINDYLNLEFPRSSSFSSTSIYGENGVAVNFGYKFSYKNFYYTPELFANYDPSSVQDLTVVPEQSFTGQLIIPNILPNRPPTVIEIPVNIPATIQPIKYTMPINIGMISRVGYDFENISINILNGGTLTIFTVDDGINPDTIYKGRFVAGFGFEWKLTKSKNLNFFADYKHFLPLKKEIEESYPDPSNPDKETKVLIKHFAASTQIFEVGIKYYF